MKSLKFIRNVNSIGIFFLLISFIGICTSCTHGKVIAAGVALMDKIKLFFVELSGSSPFISYIRRNLVVIL